MIDLGREADLPLVATNDTHYLFREHADAHDALLCIQTGKVQSDPNRLRFEASEMYMKSGDEMAALFGEVPESLANTLRIAESCNVTLEFGRLRLPHFPCRQLSPCIRKSSPPAPAASQPRWTFVIIFTSCSTRQCSTSGTTS